MIRKVVAIWVCLAMVFGLIMIVDVVTDITPSVRATTLYVNETGSNGAYTSIQDAINSSNDGDIIFVYTGLYQESILINKSISLIGEDRNNTIIDGTGKEDVIKIISSWVNVSFFTLDNIQKGIRIYNVNNITIRYNNLSYMNRGIIIESSIFCIIEYNDISFNSDQAISAGGECNNNIIRYNKMNFNNAHGMAYGGSSNIISNNIISSNRLDGIYIHGIASFNNTISNNDLINNKYGIKFESAANNNWIYNNNFINNQNAVAPWGVNDRWNNSYPIGGNFWSGYSGFDNFSGPNQDQPGSDGIGDTPFVLDPNDTDYYPLMNPIGNISYLYPGWNLISVPYIQTNTDITNVLSSISGSFNAVQSYNTTTQDHWKHNCYSKPSSMNDLNDITHLEGFWIYISKTNGVPFDYYGIAPTENQMIFLRKGWNLVGYPSISDKYRTDALNNIVFGIHVDAIYFYNAGAQLWQEVGEFNYFIIGYGYWIHATQDCVWNVPV